MAYRVDIGELKKPQRLPDGRIIVDGLLTRTGVFIYLDAEGKEFREYRPPGEVFNADSLKSFQLVPVTDDHPEGMVHADNARDVSIGTVGENVRRDERFVRAPLAINDAGTILKMERGKVELSCGYTADLEFTAGVSPEGEQFDAIQRNIRGNHVAIVERGRAGPQVKVRIDSMRVMRTEQRDTMDPEQLKAYQKALADLATAQHEASVSSKRADAAEKSLEAEKARADAAEAQLGVLTTERDTEKARADAAEKAREDEAAGAETRVRARMDLEDSAKRVLGDEYKEDMKQSDRELHLAIVKKVDGVELDKEQSDDYVKAYADSSLRRAKANKESLRVIRGGIHADDGDGEDLEEKAEAAMEKRHDERFKGSK